MVNRFKYIALLSQAQLALEEDFQISIVPSEIVSEHVAAEKRRPSGKHDDSRSPGFIFSDNKFYRVSEKRCVVTRRESQPAFSALKFVEKFEENLSVSDDCIPTLASDTIKHAGTVLRRDAFR